MNILKYFSTAYDVDVYGSDLYDKGNEYVYENAYKTIDGKILHFQNIKFDMFDEKYINNVINSINKDIYIVMNPPFSKYNETLEFYLKLLNEKNNIKAVCLLHTLRTLEGKKRKAIMECHGFPKYIINMTQRYHFITHFDGEPRAWVPPFSCCWSIWEKGKKEKDSIMKFI